ncbi:MAG: signal peptidase I, partial [Chloroflexota bacterium]
MENLRQQTKPETTKRPLIKRSGDFLQSLEQFTFIVALFVLINMLTARFVVDGESMSPTFAGGEYLVVDRFSYNLAPPQRGDIVVFHAPNQANRDFVKRVLGL